MALTGFGAEGRISHDVVEPDLVATALTVAAQDLGPAFFDHLFKLLEVETSASLRFDILAAVGSAEDPLSLARARNLLLDERLLGNEVPWLLRKLTGPSRIDGTWAWFRGNRSAVVGRYPGFSRFTLPLQFSRFCRPERMEELRAFFAGYERSIPGIAVTSRQAREKIAICDAYRARHGVELRDFFSALIGGVGGP